MRSTLAVLLVALVLGGGLGCRKKTAPQYYDLESRYSVAISRDGDEAYGSAEMDGIVAGLTAIPTDAVEGPKAQAVLASIAEARGRLAKEKADAERAIVPTVRPIISADPQPKLGAGTGSDAPDAGELVPTEPTGGMSLDDFTKYFGPCMVDLGPVDASGVTEKGHGFSNQDSALCKQKLHLDDASTATFVFVGGRLAERRLVRTTVTMVDAGPAPAPPAAPQPTSPYLPGMPAPEGAPTPINGLSPQDAG